MTRTIAYVDHAAEIGGAEKSLVELIAHIDRERFAPVVLHVPGAEWLRYAEGAGARLVPRLPQSDLYDEKRDELGGGAVVGLRRMLAATGPVAGLYREIGAIAPDLVHTNSTKMHLLAGAAARLRRLPVVWHMRDLMTQPGARSWLARAVRRIRPEVIAISQAVAGQFDGLPCRVHVVPNGVPLQDFHPGEPREGLREEIGLPDGAPAVCVVGRLTPWKGHQVLLRAWASVVRAAPDARLLVVGEVAFWEDGYEDELRSLAADLGIEDGVLWLGFREDVADLLRLSDLLVLASIDEPFGRVVIEAMATGLPVVATDSGGVPEIVVDGETGLLVPPERPEPMADAIVQVLGDPSRAGTMGEAGRRRAVELFDVRRVARQVGEIYRDIFGD